VQGGIAERWCPAGEQEACSREFRYDTSVSNSLIPGRCLRCARRLRAIGAASEGDPVRFRQFAGAILRENDDQAYPTNTQSVLQALATVSSPPWRCALPARWLPATNSCDARYWRTC
jgi:hypothetical protein